MRVLLIITVLIASLISFGQAPPMKIGGPQGIETKRILTQDWMSIPVLSDTPVAPLTGAGWPGKGYIVFVAKTGNCVGGNDCPPKDTAVWEYTGQRWKRIGSDYLTKVVFGGNVQQSNTFSRQYTVSSYGAFINGYYYRNPAATAVTLDSKSSDSTSRIDVIVLTKSGVSVRKGDAKLIPYKPTIGSEEIELSTAYFNAYDTVSRFIPTSAVGVANIFRVPGRDSIYFTIDTVTVAIKDSVGITKNDTLEMLNPYKFTAANGITKDSTVFRIGGSLNQNTAINLSDRNLYISRILGDTAVRFSSDGKVLIGTTDSTEAHRFRVSGNSRIGFLQITNGGNATNTGQGIRIDGVDRSFVLQGSSGDNAVDMFRFTNFSSDTTTSPLTNNSKGVIRIYGGFRLPNTTNLSGNVLWLTPRYNFTDTAHTTSTTVRGIYYNPTVASISGVRHIAYQNTTGSNLLNSTSGNTRIGYNANDTTFKLDVNGRVRISDTLTLSTTPASSDTSTNDILLINSSNGRVSRYSGNWFSSSAPTLQQVTAQGNTTTNEIRKTDGFGRDLVLVRESVNRGQIRIFNPLESGGLSSYTTYERHGVSYMGVYNTGGVIAYPDSTAVPQTFVIGAKLNGEIKWPSAGGVIDLGITMLSASATLDFPSTNSQEGSDLTVTVTGAAAGDVVSIGVPSASVEPHSAYTAWVSAADTVTIRFNNYGSGGSHDPASGLFKIKVFK